MEIIRRHLPEYLMEAAGLGAFMISAGLFGTLLGSPASLTAQVITDPFSRRACMGVVMGLTAILIIYSPWGRQSGAHLNPSVTFTYWTLGMISGVDAACYAFSQFIGGTAGVLLVTAALGADFSNPPVRYVSTIPGEFGISAAFAAELLIAFLLMSIVLRASNHPKLSRFTGVFAGIFVALSITFEAPFSGMSMNPARSFASAFPGQLWHALWVYFTAPLLGMVAAASVYRASGARIYCAKMNHETERRCIFCCHYEDLLREKHHQRRKR